MSKKQHQGMTIEELIERREEIERKITSVCSSLSNMPPVQQLVIAAGEALSRVKSFDYLNGRNKEAFSSEAQKSEYHNLKKDAEEKRLSSIEARKTEESLRQELASLKEELASLDYFAKVNDLKKYYDQVAESKRLIEELNHAIAVEREKAALGNTESQVLVELLREKEDILADRAIGNDIDKKRLEILEKQIEEEASIVKEQRQAASQAESVISGLNRKLKEAEERLDSFQKTLETVCLYYLSHEAERNGHEYAELASKLMEKAQRIIAIGKMIEKHPEANRLNPIYSGHNEGFRIPGFNLESCQGTDKDDKWVLFKTDHQAIRREIESFHKDLQSVGVQIRV